MSTLVYTKSYACNGIVPILKSPVEDQWNKIHKTLITQKKSVSGVSYIAALEGNGVLDEYQEYGKRETIIFIPTTTSLDKPVDIIFYFHGLKGFTKRDFERRTLGHTAAINPKRNYILILPEMPWSTYCYPHDTIAKFLRKKMILLFFLSQSNIF